MSKVDQKLICFKEEIFSWYWSLEHSIWLLELVLVFKFSLLYFRVLTVILIAVWILYSWCWRFRQEFLCKPVVEDTISRQFNVSNVSPTTPVNITFSSRIAYEKFLLNLVDLSYDNNFVQSHYKNSKDLFDNLADDNNIVGAVLCWYW